MISRRNDAESGFVLPERLAKEFRGDDGSAIGLHARPIDFAKTTAADHFAEHELVVNSLAATPAVLFSAFVVSSAFSGRSGPVAREHARAGDERFAQSI